MDFRDQREPSANCRSPEASQRRALILAFAKQVPGGLAEFVTDVLRLRFSTVGFIFLN
jgi:hypothetical protein